MKPIKFYGESKTGTTYLQKLLELNVHAEVIPGNPDSPLGWKHGFPQAGDATYIFIFRNIYETAKSLKADSIDKRFKGLEAKFGDCSEDHWKPWVNWIECRTAKYYSYAGFAQYNPFKCYFLSYEYLRDKPTCINRITPIKREFEIIESHTYIDTDGINNPNRKELTKEEIEFIDRNKDVNLEGWIDTLTLTDHVYE